MGLRCPVAGTVLRIDGKDFIVRLDRGPTAYDVIREQRHVAKTFPDWKPCRLNGPKADIPGRLLPLPVAIV